MRKKRKKDQSQIKVVPIIISGCILLLSVVVGVSFWPKQQVAINREAVILRMAPDTLAEAVIELPRSIEVRLLEEQSGWSRVRTEDNYEGWLPNWLLNNPSLLNDQEIAAQFLIDTPIYSEMEESAPLIERVDAGSYLLIEQESQGWLSVQLASYEQVAEESTAIETFGYIPTRLVNLVPEERALNYIQENKLKELRAYNPAAIASARLEDEPTVTIQYANEPLFEEPSTYSEELYRAMPGDEFALVGEFSKKKDDDFYLIENSEGQRGYVDSDRVAVSTFSVGRVEGPIVSQLSQATIMLDPGHGGVDTGALSWDRLAEEKVVTLDLAWKIKKQLEAKGATVLMTRAGDDYVELVERARASNVNQVDLFISLHIDDSEDYYSSGTSTYYYHETDKALAEAVNNQLDNLALENIGVIFGNYHVLRENTRPSILLELGYMSNDYDVEVIFSPDYQESIAKAITKGLETYFTAAE